MKSPLWYVLAVAALVNVAGNFFLHGLPQTLFSAVTGAAVLGTAAVLYARRQRRA